MIFGLLYILRRKKAKYSYAARFFLLKHAEILIDFPRKYRVSP